MKEGKEEGKERGEQGDGRGSKEQRLGREGRGKSVGRGLICLGNQTQQLVLRLVTKVLSRGQSRGGPRTPRGPLKVAHNPLHPRALAQCLQGPP